MVDESVLDSPQKSLCSLVWSKSTDGNYYLNPQLRQKIMKLCNYVFSQKSLDWMNKKANRNWKVEDYQVHIIGSITSNTYSKNSDIDIHFIIPSIPKKDAVLFSDTLRLNYKDNYLPDNPTQCYGGNKQNKFPFELYYQPNIFMDMTSIGCYNVLDGVWEVGPTLVDKDFNPYSAYFKKSLENIEDVISDVRNIILEPYELAKVIMHIDKDDHLYRQLAKQLIQLLKKSYDISKVVWGRRNYKKVAHDKKTASKIRNDKTKKIIDASFKLLEKFGYISILRDFVKAWEKFEDRRIDVDDVVETILMSVGQFIKADDECIKESKRIQDTIKLQVEDMNNERQLDEAGLIINKNDGAYPKEGQILIMAGGGGSGKSFILENLLLFEGKVFNIDHSKECLRLYGKKKPDGKIAQKFKQRYGYELKDISLKNPQHCNDIHEFLVQYRLAYEPQALFFKAAQVSKIKPNVIFDITLKDLQHLEIISAYAQQGGYDPKNIHVVWVLNDIKVALDQNAKRERTEPTDVIVTAHNGVATSMKALFDYSEKWRQAIDGDIWIVFNKKGVDVHTTVNINRDDLGNKKITMKIDDYSAIHMKERGKPALKFNQIEKPLMDKILSYVPDTAKAKLQADLKEKDMKNNIPADIQHYKDLLEDDVEEPFDGFFGDDSEDSSTKYFVAVMQDNKTKECSFTFVEATDDEDARLQLKNKFPNAKVLKVQQEKNDASYILKSLGLQNAKRV